METQPTSRLPSMVPQTAWKDYEAHLCTSFEDWFASKDCAWKQKYGPKTTSTMEKNPRSASPSVSSESKDGLRAPANTQSPTPQPSPPASPKPISPAKAWLLSISAMPEEPFQLSSPPPSPSSTSQPANINLPSFANDFFEVRTSTKGGLGAFAVADIPNDTIIMAEEPLFRAEPVQIFWKYEALSDEQKKEYKTLSCWYGVEDHKIQAIFTTNRFETGKGRGGIFLKSSRFNHACHPFSTCTYRWKESINTLSFTTLMDVKKGDEITISYTNKPRTLYDNYGFHCDCPKCRPPKDLKEVEEPSVEVAYKI